MPKKQIIEIPLSPYIGRVFIVKTKAAYEKKHMSLFGKEGLIGFGVGGMYSGGSDKNDDLVYLVWGTNKSSLAHELSHIILDLFSIVDIDPRGCNGEPFCYMLSHLLEGCD